MLFVVLCPGTPEGSTDKGSGLKRLRRRDNGLKSHPTDWEKQGIEPATPGLQDIGLSPTPRRFLTFPGHTHLRDFVAISNYDCCTSVYIHLWDN